nr:TonB-dependent receptor plug domain-containing protein [Allomuricauda sp.]
MTKLLSIMILAFGVFWGTHVQAQNTENVTICWDVSLSMQNRDLEKDFYFLDAYFKTAQNAKVTVLTFSDQVLSKHDFVVSAGSWTDVKEKLKGLSYDGATSYASLGNYVTGGTVLLFTDGRQNLGTSTPSFGGKLFIVNSTKNFDRGSLNLLSIVNNGDVVNFMEKKSMDESIDPIEEYSGTILSGTAGLSNAEVYIQGNEEDKVRSDEKGGFSIHGKPGDTLIAMYGDKMEKQVLGDSKTMNFSLGDGGVQLQEVVVSERKAEPEEKIITAYGEENKDAVGYAVQSITEDDIPDAASTVNMAVQGKFSGVNLGNNEDLSQVRMRPRNTILGNVYGLIVVDGVPLRQSGSHSGVVYSTDFVNPENIADITVLKGLAATNKYGSLGANGVLLITTKTATYAKQTGEKKDLARLTDNIYKEKIKVNTKTLVTPYLKELKGGKNIREAYDIYLAQRAKYQNEPSYFLDVSNFFFGTSPEIALRILSNVLESEDTDYGTLRSLYLRSVEIENHDMALLAANRLFEVFPNKIQSYLDVAMSQEQLGNYQEALNMYNGMLTGEANPQLNFRGMEKVVGTEVRNLVNKHRAELDISKVNPKYHNNLTYNARLVLDWNQPDAEFSVQFVNPQKRFFTWEHTEVGDRKRILDELENGNSTEQFEIVGSDTKGEWILNVTYDGNRTPANKAATFLKCSVEYNFGKPNQRKEEFLIRLQEVGEEVQLAKFSVD